MMLNEYKIKTLCDKRNFHYNYFGDNAIISTKVDQWMLEGFEIFDENIDGYKKIIRLKHRNNGSNNKGKVHFHTQRTVSNINHAFETIVQHEENKTNYNKAFRMKDIFKKIV